MKNFMRKNLIPNIIIMSMSMNTTFAVDIGVSVSKSQKSTLENKKIVSYHTVKNFDSLRDTIESANDGDVIILTQDINRRDNLTIKNKELTIVSNDSRYGLNVNYINVDNGKLNLGVKGTKNPLLLRVNSRFFLNNSTLNLYDSACIINTIKCDRWENGCWHESFSPLINAKDTDSEINIYGGVIEKNHFNELIAGGTKTTLTIDGGAIRNNSRYSCNNNTQMFNIKNFKLKNGCVSDNNNFTSISTEKATISGGTSNLLIQANNADVSGGTINNISAANIAVSGKVTIGKLVSQNITVKDKLNKDSSITVYYDKYKINNQQKVVNVNGGIDIRDVFNNFKLSNSNYFVNNKGYVDDVPSHKYEFEDINTGIKVESDDKIIVCKNDSPDKATFFISQLNDADNEIVHSLNFYKDGKLVKSEDIKNISIYIPYVNSKLDLNKLNSIKICDSNGKEITNCNKTVKYVDVKLYSLIIINNKL